VLFRPAAVRTDVLRRVLRVNGFGEPHHTLADAAVWYDPDSDRVLDDRAEDAFRRAGLADGDLDWLAALSQPSVECYGWITEGDITTAVLAAARGGGAVVATRRRQGVHLAPADPRRLTEALLAHLPPVRAGQGPSINVRRARLLAGSGGPEWSAFTALHRTGAGELYAAVRDRVTGRRRAIDRPVGYQDTTAGRWLVQVVVSHGEEWVTVAPATTELFVRRLSDALRDLHAFAG
jgi:hypothetical protein